MFTEIPSTPFSIIHVHLKLEKRRSADGVVRSNNLLDAPHRPLLFRAEINVQYLQDPVNLLMYFRIYGYFAPLPSSAHLTNNTAGKSSDDSDGTPGKTDDTRLTKTDGHDPSANDSPEKSRLTHSSRRYPRTRHLQRRSCRPFSQIYLPDAWSH
jgi:hypothetical protein